MVDVGGYYRSTYEVHDETGALVNASTISLKIYKPDGTAVTPDPTLDLPDSTGKYHYDYLTADIGRHTGVWSTAGPVTTRGFSFDVGATESTAIVDLTSMKKHLNMSLDITTDDEELLEFVLVATDIVESKVGFVALRTVTNERQPEGSSLWLRCLPVVEILSILPYKIFGIGYTVSWTTFDAESGRVELLNGYDFLGGPFKVTYRAGRKIVDPSIRQGAKEVVRHLWETQRGGTTFIGSGPGPEADDEMFFSRGKEYSVPRRVLELLAPATLAPRVA